MNKCAWQSLPGTANTLHRLRGFYHPTFSLDLVLVIFTFSLIQKSYWAESDELQSAVTGGSRVLGGDIIICGQKDESLNVGVYVYK